LLSKEKKKKPASKPIEGRTELVQQMLRKKNPGPINNSPSNPTVIQTTCINSTTTSSRCLSFWQPIKSPIHYLSLFPESQKNPQIIKIKFLENPRNPNSLIYKMHTKSHQIFIQSQNPQFKTQTLTLDPTQTLTLYNLKLSLITDNQNPSSFYFTLNGKPLKDSTCLPNPQITPLCTLILQVRLSGGGGDGGATGAESRDCYLNMYADKKPDKVDPRELRLSKWLNCSLSNEPLRQPCVIDRLGNMFNKEALVEALIGKKLPKEFGYIKGLKDMIDIQLEVVPGEGSGNARFQCPVTGLEFNGKYKFFALKNCGHVLSAKALKEVKSSECLVCYKEFEECDKIVINGSDEEVAVLRERMEEERSKMKEKKMKKVKNGEVGANGEEFSGQGAEVSQVSGKKHGIVDVKGVDKVVGKVKGNGKVENVKGVSHGGSVKRFKATDMVPTNATKEVYASIFTSSKKQSFKETYSCRSLPLGRN
jgi:hypothetical protein